ncbi:hypothetical protein BDV93DRAFT_456195 [Ceratobasidium sp. AG-I]|nr:hypothetical protein BDV93DRAFT_456195 [Ceratobasidium sp. AG-I]
MADTQVLTEEQVMNGFHAFLVSALRHAKAERLLTDELLASAEADLMICGPALCLYFAALRSNTNPPGVPLPRPRGSDEPQKRLSAATCPPGFLPFFELWARAVPRIQSLAPEHTFDLASIICNKAPVTLPADLPSPFPDSPSGDQTILAKVHAIAADLRAVAIEISQRRSFQLRYTEDLQAALNLGDPTSPAGPRRTPATATFVAPPGYDEGPPAAPTPPPLSVPGSSRVPARPASPSLLTASDPSIVIIRETLYAGLGDAISEAPTLKQLLVSDPPRAYFASVALAILNVSLTSITPRGSVRAVLGQELTLEDCPPPLRPLMMELAGIGESARELSEEDDKRAMHLAERGLDIPEPRIDRLKRTLQTGVAGQREEEHDPSDSDEGRRSPSSTTVRFANRINELALRMTALPAFRERQQEVFSILQGVGV